MSASTAPGSEQLYEALREELLRLSQHEEEHRRLRSTAGALLGAHAHHRRRPPPVCCRSACRGRRASLPSNSRLGRGRWRRRATDNVPGLRSGVPPLAFRFWWAGRRWRDRALHLMLGRDPTPRGMARREALAVRLERMAERFGPAAVVLAYYLPLPSLLVYVAAGLVGMRLRTFLALDIVGLGYVRQARRARCPADRPLLHAHDHRGGPGGDRRSGPETSPRIPLKRPENMSPGTCVLPPGEGLSPRCVTPHLRS